MSDMITTFGSVPEGRRLGGEPDRPAGRFGILRPSISAADGAVEQRGAGGTPPVSSPGTPSSF
jgi:hypothetical protein